jgi:hypothetical protein
MTAVAVFVKALNNGFPKIESIRLGAPQKRCAKRDPNDKGRAHGEKEHQIFDWAWGVGPDWRGDETAWRYDRDRDFG